MMRGEASRCCCRSSSAAESQSAARGQRGVKVVLGHLEKLFRGPEQPSRPRRRGEGRGIVAGEEARLQLADPVQHAATARSGSAREAPLDSGPRRTR